MVDTPSGSMNTIESRLKQEKEERIAQVTQLQEENAQLKTQVAEQGARIAEQDARIAEQDARIAEQDAQIADLHKENVQLKTRISELNEKLDRFLAGNVNMSELFAAKARVAFFW